MPINLDFYNATLSRDFPGFIKSVQEIGMSGSGAALLVNGEFVFRLPAPEVFSNPDNESRRVDVAREINILISLRRRLPPTLYLPEPKYLAPSGLYFGYRMVGGIVASQVQSTLAPDKKLQFYNELGAVMASFHQALSPNEAAAMTVPFYDTRESLRNLKWLIENGSLSEIESSSLHKVSEWIDALQQSPKLSLMHNDMGMSNVLIDINSERLINGIIGWSHVSIGPQEYDIARAASWSVDEFNALVNSYNQNSSVGDDVRLNVTHWMWFNAAAGLTEALQQSNSEMQLLWRRRMNFLSSYLMLI